MIKNIILAVLVIAVIVLAYMLFVSFPKKAEAECQASVEDVIKGEVEKIVEAEVMSAVEQCTTQVQQQYEEVFSRLLMIPECAELLQ